MVKLIDLSDMYQIFAHKLLRLFDQLRSLEADLLKKNRVPFTEAETAAVVKLFGERLAEVRVICQDLELSSAAKQVRHILEQRGIVDGSQVAPQIEELRRRIREDMEDHVYLCVPGSVASRFFNKDSNGHYNMKVPRELMDSVIVSRFPASSDDIEQACNCYILDQYSACVFHLMRVVEIGVLKVAKIGGFKILSPPGGQFLST